MKNPKSQIIGDSELSITAKCNQNCIYCAVYGESADSKAELLAGLSAGHKTISILGGEPLLSKDLDIWVKRAKKSGADEIILLTNGILLDEQRIKKLLKNGVTHFQINFPAHIEKIHDIITGTKNLFPGKLKIIKNAIKLYANKITLNCVLNSINYKILPQYISFVSKEFPTVFSVNIIFIMVHGAVKKRKYLVPKFSDAVPYVKKALERAKKLHIPVIIDQFPLCVLDGYEEYSLDVEKMLKNKGKATYYEHIKIQSCLSCSLNNICAGLRKDYLKIFGDKEFFASKKNPLIIIEKIEKKGGQLYLNV